MCYHYWNVFILELGVMEFNATFNNISVISWVSVTLVEDTAVLRENHWLVTSQWQTLSHNVVSRTPFLSGLELATLDVIGTHWIGSFKSNYHMITSTTAMNMFWLIDWLNWFLVFNATFSNISAISWWPVLVVEEAWVPGENHRPWVSN